MLLGPRVPSAIWTRKRSSGWRWPLTAPAPLLFQGPSLSSQLTWVRRRKPPMRRIATNAAIESGRAHSSSKASRRSCGATAAAERAAVVASCSGDVCSLIQDVRQGAASGCVKDAQNHNKNGETSREFQSSVVGRHGWSAGRRRSYRGGPKGLAYDGRS